ncbi:MAG: mechanosensitive ion channel family protein [Holosporales bacterium]|nr:mechanosensitive ion channel family protein [Holosporales bacterium]
MNKNQIRIVIVGVLSFILLSIAFAWSDSISPNNVGTKFDYEKIVRAIIVAIMAITGIRVLFLAAINPWEIRNNKHIPSIIKDLIGFAILLIAALFVITNVYGQSAIMLFIGLGASGIGIVYVAQDSLKELIAGIALAVQNNFEIGNWIKLTTGTTGKIIRMRLTGIDLYLVDSTIMFIPNTSIANKDIVNLSKPGQSFSCGVNLMLEHRIPVERARRILTAATLGAEGVKDGDVLVVADNAVHNGVLFSVYFTVPNFESMLEVRHKVLAAITTHLHKHNMKICEVTGQINIGKLDPKLPRTFEDDVVTDAMSTLNFSGLLDDCTADVKSRFASKMIRNRFTKGETICQQGDSDDTMYIIAEGSVNVVIEVAVKTDSEVARTSSTVAILTDGDYFGEMALLCGEKRNATIVAKTDVIVYVVERETVKMFMAEHQDFAKKLGASIVAKAKNNDSVRSGIMEKLTAKEASVSEFVNAFRLFLGVHTDSGITL